MRALRGGSGVAGTGVTLGALVTLIFGCDATAAASAYLGGHDSHDISPDAHSPASAAVTPAPVPSGASLPSHATPEAESAPFPPSSAGAPTRVSRPFEVVPPPARARSDMNPNGGLVPQVTYPTHGGISTPLHPIPGAVELGAPVSRGPVVIEKVGAGTRHVSVGGAQVSGGNLSNAARVIAGLRAPLRDCYAREASPASGAMRFAVSVGPAGAPTVAVTKSAELSSRLLSCATAAAQNLRFDAPESGAATIRFPVTFVSDSPAKGGAVPNPTLPVPPKGTTTL